MDGWMDGELHENNSPKGGTDGELHSWHENNLLNG